MTNAVAQATNSLSPINGLDVVNAVNGFYSGAFTNIVWLLGILVTLFGLAIGAIYYLLQNLQLKLQKEKLEKKFTIDFEELKKNLREENTKAFSIEKKAIEQKFQELKKTIERSSKVSESVTFSLLGTIYEENNKLEAALRCFAKSATAIVEAENIKSVQSDLRYMVQFVLPKMNKTQFESKEVLTDVDGIIKAAKKINLPGSELLQAVISDFENALAEAKTRPKK